MDTEVDIIVKLMWEGVIYRTTWITGYATTSPPRKELQPGEYTTNMYLYTVFVFLIVSAVIDVSQGILCYQCASTIAAAAVSGYTVSDQCDVIGDNTPTVDCSGQCQSTFASSGVARGCGSSCTASSNGTNDVTCCDTDKCNSGGPEGSGWTRCYSCLTCPEDYKTASNKDYTYCQGQCFKLNSEANVLGSKISATIRSCVADCQNGKQSANVLGLVSGSNEMFCCAAQDCNSALRLMWSQAGLVVCLVAAAALG